MKNSRVFRGGEAHDFAKRKILFSYFSLPLLSSRQSATGHVDVAILLAWRNLIRRANPILEIMLQTQKKYFSSIHTIQSSENEKKNRKISAKRTFFNDFGLARNCCGMEWRKKRVKNELQSSSNFIVM